jgi:hypothetical protein
VLVAVSFCFRVFHLRADFGRPGRRGFSTGFASVAA